MKHAKNRSAASNTARTRNTTRKATEAGTPSKKAVKKGAVKGAKKVLKTISSDHSSSARPALLAAVSLVAATAVGFGLVTLLRRLFASEPETEGTFDNMTESDSIESKEDEGPNLDREFGIADRESSGEGFDTQYTGAYPRNSGAFSAVTNGSPEDLNYMPATQNPSIEGPIYDGTQLGSEP